MPISEYRIMWIFVLFDLPVLTKEHRRDYTTFRKKVLSLGFTQLQLSVYAKHLPSEDAGEHLKVRIMAALPPRGTSPDVDGYRSAIRQDGGLLWPETA